MTGNLQEIFMFAVGPPVIILNIATLVWGMGVALLLLYFINFIVVYFGRYFIVIHMLIF